MRCENKSFLQNDPGFLQEITSTAVEVRLSFRPGMYFHNPSASASTGFFLFIITKDQKDLWIPLKQNVTNFAESLGHLQPEWQRINPRPTLPAKEEWERTLSYGHLNFTKRPVLWVKTTCYTLVGSLAVCDE